jgi:hypothetical protein
MGLCEIGQYRYNVSEEGRRKGVLMYLRYEEEK